MKIARVLTGSMIALWLGACATQHAEQQAAPVASPSNGNLAPAPVLAPGADQAPATAPAPPPAAAPQGLDQPKSQESARDEESFTTLADAERALNQAKADLDRLALAEPTLGRGAAGSAEKRSAKRGAPSAAGASAPAAASPDALCDNACRAFASLTRAANAVCRLDGDSGSHCTRAKRVVEDSAHRVASCSCGAAPDQ